MTLPLANEIYVCPRETLMFTCCEQSRTQIQWIVQFVSVSMSSIEEFFWQLIRKGKSLKEIAMGSVLCFYSVTHQLETQLSWSHQCHSQC